MGKFNVKKFEKFQEIVQDCGEFFEEKKWPVSKLQISNISENTFLKMK